MGEWLCAFLFWLGYVGVLECDSGVGLGEQVFYGPREPTYLLDTDPYHQMRTHRVPPPAYPYRDVDPVYRTRALVAPKSTETHIVPVHSPGNRLKTHSKVSPRPLWLVDPFPTLVSLFLALKDLFQQSTLTTRLRSIPSPGSGAQRPNVLREMCEEGAQSSG